MKSSVNVVLFVPAMLCLLSAPALAHYDPAVGRQADDSWDPGPRLRIGISGLAGANSFLNGGYDQQEFVLSDHANGAGGFAVSFVVGAQWTDLLSTELELEGAALVGEELRTSALVMFTPVSWFSAGLGPALGVNFKQECPSNSSFLSSSQSSGPCAAYSAGYMAGEARLDFLPGGGSGENRRRRSFDIAVEVVACSSLKTAPQGDQTAGGGFYFLLGYLWC